MSERTVADHPSIDDLRAFGLGQLAGEAASSVEDHVSHCAECCQTLKGVGSDTLIHLVRAVGQPANPPEILTLGLAALPPTPGTAADASAGPDEVAACPLALRDHPRYRVLALLGKGGMGAVFKAEHRLMGRPVAIKVINQALTSKPAIVERFRREVQAAARLAHANIVAAHDAEQAGDTHFLVMEFVEGTDLARLAAERGRLPVAEACDYVRQAARGLQHAHERGMVHRDVKPHNLMRTADGIVKVLDFGLARWASEAGSAAGGETGQGVLLGTVDYMAPEQADSAHDADIRSDIYSLGCTLYFLLAGRPPFPDGTLIQKVAAHAGRVPTPLAELRPDLPPGLLEVLHAMMAKSPALRYRTPAQVDSALEPFASTRFGGATVLRLAGNANLSINEATRADREIGVPGRRPTAPRRGWRRMAVGAAVLLGLLALLAYLFGPAVVRYASDEGELVIEIDDPQVQTVIDQTGVTLHDKATDRSYKVRPGRRDLKAGDYEIEVTEVGGDVHLFTKEFTITRGGTTPVKVTLDLSKLTPAPEVVKPTAEEKVGEKRMLEGFNDNVWSVAFAPDGHSYLATGGINGLYDRNSGRELRRFPGSGWFAAFSPDGRRVLTADLAMQNLLVWDAATGKQLQKIAANAGRIRNGAFSPDGQMVIANHWNTVRVWDIQTGKQLAVFDAEPGAVHSFQSVPGGRTLLVANPDHSIRVIDTTTWQEVGHWKPHPNRIIDLDISPDGRTLLVCSGGGEEPAFVWDVASGREVGRQGALGKSQPGYRCAAFAPDGRRAISTNADGTIILWDVAGCKELQRWEKQGEIASVAIAPDGRDALFGLADKKAFLMRLPDPPPPAKPELLHSIPWQVEGMGVGTHIYHTGISSDGRFFFGAGGVGPTGAVRVYDAATGNQVRELVPGGEVWYSSAQFLPGGQYLVAGYLKEKDLYLWDVAANKIVRKFIGHTEPNPDFAVSPDGKRLLSWGDDKTVRLWDVDAGMELRKLEGHTDKAAGTFSPDGKQVLTFSPDKTLRLWDVESGKELQKLEGHTDACTGCFSPDGKQALSYGPDGTIRLWDLGTGKEVRRFEGPTGKVGFAGFVAGGRLVVGSSGDLKYRVWDAVGGKLVNEIDGARYGREGWNINASPDGQLALVGDVDDSSIRVLDLATGKETHRYDQVPVTRAFSFSPDGTWVVVGSFRAGLSVLRLPAGGAANP